MKRELLIMDLHELRNDYKTFTGEDLKDGMVQEVAEAVLEATLNGQDPAEAMVNVYNKNKTVSIEVGSEWVHSDKGAVKLPQQVFVVTRTFKLNDERFVAYTGEHQIGKVVPELLMKREDFLGRYKLTLKGAPCGRVAMSPYYAGAIK